MRSTSVVAVTVADVRCAVEVGRVQEVVPAAWVEPLPDAPPQVMGVLDLRGDLVAVIDAHRCFGLPAVSLRTSDCFVVLACTERPLVLRVDAVDGIVDVSDEKITSARAVMPEVMSASGIARLDDGLIVICDPDRFLSAHDADQVRRALLDARPVAV